METATTEKAEGLNPSTLKPCVVEVDAMRFKAAINAALIAISRDRSRPILAGVLVVHRGDYVELVSTDSYRLSVIPVATRSVPDTFEPVNIDGASLKQLSAMLKPFTKPETGTVKVTIEPQPAGPALVVAEVADFRDAAFGTIPLKAIEGEYPKLVNLIPNPCDFWSGLDAGAEGIGFNPKYLGDAAKWGQILNKGYGNKDLPLVWGAVDGLKPAVLTAAADTDTPNVPAPMFLLMPVRLAG